MASVGVSGQPHDGRHLGELVQRPCRFPRGRVVCLLSQGLLDGPVGSHHLLRGDGARSQCPQPLGARRLAPPAAAWEPGSRAATVRRMSNQEQAEYWDGPGGEHWIAEADRYTRMTAPVIEHLMGAARLQPGERVLDIGCGMGPTTFAAAERVGPEGSVVGVDLSGPMLAAARKQAEAAGLDHVRFEQADAQEYRFEPGASDVAISRFGVMFFEDPAAAFSNLASALRPGGRLAFSCWRDLFSNQWLAVPVTAALQHVPVPELGGPGSPGPFSLADADRVREILISAGFEGVTLDAVDLPLRVGSDAADFVEFGQHSDMGDVLMEGVDEPTRAKAWAAVAEAVKPYEREEGLLLDGSLWLVQAAKP